MDTLTHRLTLALPPTGMFRAVGEDRSSLLCRECSTPSRGVMIQADETVQHARWHLTILREPAGPSLPDRVECDREFGVDHEHDAEECERILWEMSHGADAAYDAYADAYNREAEEESLGRPLFPNEY